MLLPYHGQPTNWNAVSGRDKKQKPALLVQGELSQHSLHVHTDIAKSELNTGIIRQYKIIIKNINPHDVMLSCRNDLSYAVYVH